MKKYLHELHKRKDLLLYLVTSALKAQYRNSFLGYSWWLLDPLLGAMIYYFVVVRIFGQGDDDYGMFLLIGVIVWQWLSATVTMASRSIIAQAGIITQVYLPKIIFPISTVLTQLINFGFGLLVIAAFAVFFHLKPSPAVIWLPYITLMQLCFHTAIAVAFSYISVFVRDIEDVASHALRIWFFCSPVIWREICSRRELNGSPNSTLWRIFLQRIAMSSCIKQVLMDGRY